MKMIIVFCLLLVLSGCSYLMGTPVTESARRIPSVNETAGCRFVKSQTILAMPYNVVESVQLKVEQAGGDSFKILSQTPAKTGGFDTVYVNIEIYRCGPK